MTVKKPFYIEFISFYELTGDDYFAKFGRDVEPSEDQIKKIMNKNPRYAHAQVYKRCASGDVLVTQYNRN